MADVYGFLFDEANEDKMSSHGITARQLTQMLENDYVVSKNRKTGTAPYLLIGYDDGGKCIAAPIMPTLEYGIWRPITAWPCKASEQTSLDKQVK